MGTRVAISKTGILIRLPKKEAIKIVEVISGLKPISAKAVPMTPTKISIKTNERIRISIVNSDEQ